uniref:BTB domain-containing protein n=1 Tax=Meloidogyne javanica TaxID=6303 RepID=A0A915MK38_MELJA
MMKTASVTNFVWVIQNPGIFKEILVSGETLTLKSPQFFDASFPDVQWEIILEISSEDYIYLRQIGPSNFNQVNTYYKLYVKEFDKQEVIISRSTHKLEKQDRLGYKKIDLYRYTYYGEFEIRCDVEFNYYNSVGTYKHSFAQMINMKLFTDCVLKIGEESIFVHKSVLAKNSEVFYKLLDQMDKENKMNIQPDVENLELNLMEQNVDNIFALAHKYQIQALKYECEMFMVNLIDNSKLLQYFNYIKLYNAQTLEKGIVTYIHLNRDVVNSEEWMNVKKLYKDIAYRIVVSVLHEE